MKISLTVNFHLLKNCNFRCKFCYAHFKDSSLLSIEECKQILVELKRNGISKVNFAGGEPLLYKNFGELLAFSKHLDFVTSIISNGSRITKNWINEYAQFLDVIGISCDSANEDTLINLGRGNGDSALNTFEVFRLMDEFSLRSGKRIFKKLNSVVTSLNCNEDMKGFVRSLNINRWKVFQILRIEGENELHYDNLKITEDEFNGFIARHAILNTDGMSVVAESNDAMTDSYLMINPDGCLYQNSEGKYIKSESILKVGFEKALKQISFSQKKFLNRGGVYSFLPNI